MNRALRSALRLGGITAAMVVLVAAIFALTREPIAEAEAQAERERLLEVLPNRTWDAPVEQDWTTVPPDPLLGLAAPHRVYRARAGGELGAIVVQATAPEGYNGEIKLLVGIDTSGVITGVRVVEHRETPGLGDFIDRSASDWIDDFEGRSLGNPPEAAWTVAPDGGEFDAFTGATITPRAVVHAVRDALRWVEAQDFDELASHKGEST